MTVNKFPRSFTARRYFVDLVLKQLRETSPQTQLHQRRPPAFSHQLDTIMQRSAEKSLVDGIAQPQQEVRTPAEDSEPAAGCGADHPTRNRL